MRVLALTPALALLSRLQVVNFYLMLVAERNAAQLAGGAAGRAAGPATAAAAAASPLPPRELPPRTHVFSSFFWTRLACSPAGFDYASVRRWTKRVVRRSTCACARRQTLLLPCPVLTSSRCRGIVAA
jgi:hypothetical protein